MVGVCLMLFLVFLVANFVRVFVGMELFKSENALQVGETLISI